MAFLVLVFLIMLPTKAFYLSIPLSAAVFLVLRWISAQKVAALGLPLSYLDLINAGADPWALIHALGLGELELLLRILVWTTALGVGLVVVVALRKVPLRRTGYRIAEAGFVLAVGFMALDAAAMDLRDRLAHFYPHIEGELWQPSGQQMLAKAAGPLEYIAFTRRLGDGDAAQVRVDQISALPDAAIEAAANHLLGPEFPKGIELPNIVMFHAESSFDPNEIFHLAEEIDLTLWSERAETRVLAPLRANVVGGASWVTEFEVLTGVDSRNFGYLGFFTHQMIGPRVKYGFPAYLAQNGYGTAAYYTEKAVFFGVAAAFQNYGIKTFRDAPDIGIAGWTDTDLEIIQKIIDFGAFTARDYPFFAFVSTNYNHGPHPCRNFQEPGEFAVHFAEVASFEQTCALNEYVLRARDTSRAVDVILEELRRLERETGRPYVVLIYGDHQPWSFTDGFYSVAGGVSKDREILSFAHLRKGPNEDITFIHLISSIEADHPDVFGQPVPVTLVPTLLSAYLATTWRDLYLPVNLLAYHTCGSDFRSAGCPLARDMDIWGRAAILSDD